MKIKRVPISLLIATALLAGCLGENPVENNLSSASREAQATKPDSIHAKPDPIYTKPDLICTKPGPIKVEPINPFYLDPRCPKERPPMDCELACTDNGGGR